VTDDDGTAAPAASRTALAVAWLRAAHQVIDGSPKLLEDPVAAPLLGPDVPEAILARRDEWQRPGTRGWRSHVLLRSRYTEDRLAAAVARGVRQYVVLGAGYDTFGYRQPAWAAGVRIFEVDQPATQRAKQDALAAAGLPIRENVTFVAVNFQRDRLDTCLRAAGLDAAAPAFVSWLGVMVYITEEAADDVFRFVASLPPGSEIVFTFAPRRAERTDPSQHLSRVAAAVAEMGEPWRTFTDPGELAAKLRRFGFSDVAVLSPADAEDRYFKGRTDGLPAPKRASIATATV
jgi:methyltransferase (TIGR00027 family)